MTSVENKCEKCLSTMADDDNLESIAVVSQDKLSGVAPVYFDMARGSQENVEEGPSCSTQGNARKTQFDSVNLDEASSSNVDDDGDDEDDGDGAFNGHKIKRLKKKKPKHVFIEGDSSSDEDENIPLDVPINPSDLTWLLWMWYYVRAVSSGALKVAEFLGERLAALFGITTPKYQYVIDEYYRRKELEREEEEKEKKERDFVAQRRLEELSKMEGGNKELVYNQVSTSASHAAVLS